MAEKSQAALAAPVMHLCTNICKHRPWLHPLASLAWMGCLCKLASLPLFFFSQNAAHHEPGACMKLWGRDFVRCGLAQPSTGRGGMVCLLNPLSLFKMSNRAPECLHLSSGTDDTVMNILIIYKAPLAQSWNPETQAPGFAVCGTDSKSIRDC